MLHRPPNIPSPLQGSHVPHSPVGTADIRQGWNAMEPLPKKHKFRTKPRRGDRTNTPSAQPIQGSQSYCLVCLDLQFTKTAELLGSAACLIVTNLRGSAYSPKMECQPNSTTSLPLFVVKD